MNVPTLANYFDLSGGYQAISQESHAIPGTSPYRFALNQIPQGKLGITAVVDNAYVADDIASLITIEVNDGTDSSPSWTARTPTSNQSPSAGYAYVQLADYVWSPQLGFNAADKGKSARITYTGWGSPVYAGYMSLLYTQVACLDAWKPLALCSNATYNRGWYDGRGLNDLTVYVAPAGFALQFTDANYFWTGDAADFGASGNCEVTAFTNANYWKRIGLFLILDTGSLVLATSEGAEAASQGALVNPANLADESILLGYVDVQDDGSKTAGSLRTITSSHLTQGFIGVRSSVMQGRQLVPLTFQTFGAIDVGAVLDGDKYPGMSLELVRADLLLTTTGSGATALRVDIRVNESGSWSSLFASDGVKPTVAANSGTDKTDTTPASDMTFTGLASGVNRTAATARFRAYVEAGENDMASATLMVWGYPA